MLLLLYPMFAVFKSKEKENGDSQRPTMTAHFQVSIFEVQTLFQVLYDPSRIEF